MWCVVVLNSPMHHRTGAAINPWPNDNRGADSPGGETLKPDVRGLDPELTSSLRLCCSQPQMTRDTTERGGEKVQRSTLPTVSFCFWLHLQFKWK